MPDFVRAYKKPAELPPISVGNRWPAGAIPFARRWPRSRNVAHGVNWAVVERRAVWCHDRPVTGAGGWRQFRFGESGTTSSPIYLTMGPRAVGRRGRSRGGRGPCSTGRRPGRPVVQRPHRDRNGGPPDGCQCRSRRRGRRRDGRSLRRRQACRQVCPQRSHRIGSRFRRSHRRRSRDAPGRFHKTDIRPRRSRCRRSGG